MLICPVCYGNLEWEISHQTQEHIEMTQVKCSGCRTDYPVRDGIGVFLASEQQDPQLWEQESRQVQYVRKHSDVESQLMDVPLETLNPADQHYRARVLESYGRFTEAKEAAERAQQGLYTASFRKAQKNQFDYIHE
jgi:uncharacterized protein YbaR (Trm112 family)